MSSVVKGLTTDDAFLHCLILAACYQLVQSALKIGFALAKKGGIRGVGQAYSRHAVHMAAALPGYRTALVALAGPFLTLLAQMGAETTPLPL